MTKLATIEYTNRRQALMQQLPQGAVAVIQCAPVHIRNGDVEHDYRQEAAFIICQVWWSRTPRWCWLMG